MFNFLKKKGKNMYTTETYEGTREVYNYEAKNVEKEARDNPVLEACLKEIITDFNTIKVGVYKKNKDGYELETGHKLMKTLRNPTSNLNISNFNEYYLRWLETGGELLLFKSGAVKIDLNIYKSGTYTLTYNKTDLTKIKIGGKEIIDKEELANYKVVRVTNIEDDIAGVPSKGADTPLRPIGRVIDMVKFMLVHMNNQLLNSGKRTGIITITKPLGPDATRELKDDIRAQSGLDSAGRMLIAKGELLTFTPLDSTPQELDWLNGLDKARELICGAMGVPVQLISSDASTFNNLKEMKAKIYRDTIVPKLNFYCEILTEFLEKELGEGRIISFSEIDIKELQQDNAKSAGEIVKLMNGLYTKNEIREELAKRFGFGGAVNDKNLDNIFIGSNEMTLEVAVGSGDPVEGGPNGA